jgi:hypothetical protein
MAPTVLPLDVSRDVHRRRLDPLDDEHRGDDERHLLPLDDDERQKLGRFDVARIGSARRGGPRQFRRSSDAGSIHLMNYDRAVIVTFAEGLYERASRLAYIYGLGFGCMFALGGVAGSTMTPAFDPAQGGIIGLVIGGVFGVIASQSRANALRLQAQQALCQAQIELNTRLAAEFLMPNRDVAPPPMAGEPPRRAPGVPPPFPDRDVA